MLRIQWIKKSQFWKFKMEYVGIREIGMHLKLLEGLP